MINIVQSDLYNLFSINVFVKDAVNSVIQILLQIYNIGLVGCPIYPTALLSSQNLSGTKANE